MFPVKLPSRLFHILRERLEEDKSECNNHVLSYSSEVIYMLPKASFKTPCWCAARTGFVRESQDTFCLVLLPVAPYQKFSPDTVENTL